MRVKYRQGDTSYPAPYVLLPVMKLKDLRDRVYYPLEQQPWSWTELIKKT